MLKDLITRCSTLKEAYPDFGQRFPDLDLKEYGLENDTAEFIQKGITPSDLQFKGDERAVVSTITTTSKDRDSEIVDPAGAILTEYKKNPVVLFGHDHRSLPVGKNIWIKLSDDKKSLIAKTEYTPEAANPIGNQIFEYRKAGFPLAYSIGFIPLEWTSFSEGDGTPEAKAGVRRKFTKWILLEYSDVPVPSNPEAVAIAVSKSLIPAKEAPEYGVTEEEVLTILESEETYECECIECGWKTTSKKHCKDIKCKECDGEMRRAERPGVGKDLEEKRMDIKGNPSIWDVLDAIHRQLRPPGDNSYTKWVADLYPTKYPDGHVIIEDTSSGQKFLQYDYKYADGVVKLSTEFAELEDTYKPSKAFEGFREKAGRTLSDKTRRIMVKAAEAMGSAAEALAVLLKESDKPKGSEADNALEDKPKEDEEDEKSFLNLIEPSPEMISIEEKDIDSLIQTRVENILKGSVSEIIRTTIQQVRGKV